MGPALHPLCRGSVPELQPFPVRHGSVLVHQIHVTLSVEAQHPSAPATPGLLLLSYTTPRDAASSNLTVFGQRQVQGADFHLTV